MPDQPVAGVYFTLADPSRAAAASTQSMFDGDPSVPWAGGVTIWNLRSHVSTSDPVRVTVTAVP